LVRNAASRNSRNLRHAALRLLILSPLLLLGGCSLKQVPVLSPDGPIASMERDLLFVGVGLMLIVVIPVFVMAAWFGWHYRASNSKARYEPEWSYSAGIDAVIWLVPIVIVAVLSMMVFIYSQRLDPVWSKNKSAAPCPFTLPLDGDNAGARPAARGIAPADHGGFRC